MKERRLNMEILEYNNKYNDQIKDLLVELQQYLVDIDDWKTQVLLSNYREDYFNLDMELVKNKEGKIYLAEENNKIVGLVIGIVNTIDEIDKLTNNCEKTGSVIELIVRKDERGKGIGKKLLEKIEEYFYFIDCKKITIEVFGPNKNALNFYKKNNYIARDFFLSKNLKEETMNSEGKQTKKLMIACSAKFQKEIQKWKKYFENNGYEVINYPRKINQENSEEYKNTYINFFKSLDETDILFVLNEEKNGIKGYIGAETFAELSYAIVQNIIYNEEKRVWLLNYPSEEVKSYMEIMNFIKLGWVEIFNNKGE